MKSLNLILIGPPGSGKGTQAELLREKNSFVHYSTGEVFRDHIRRKTPVGLQVERYVTSGGLVPDSVVLEVVNSFLAENAGKAILFDGFPRTIPQAEGLDKVLAENQLAVDMAVLVDLADDEVVKRLTARRQCRSCSKIYNLTFKPPKKGGVCDDCDGEIYQRKDDSENVIRDRLNTYHKQTEPVIGYYSTQGKLKRIDGALGRDRVYEEVTRLIGAA
ncbi:adenylate kinase [candidate division WOR-3 bacterium]|uniref:Adenylate kinase n=1 Tax=candidate division WOR-3 bacterium TaxID=2052148 RepID=A0A937XFA5_UNCW3|nr:adenylate kinase [candidate division WOR-3 bacterium]